MGNPKELTYQQMRELRRTAVSSKRASRVSAFAENLETAPAHDEHTVIFDLAGQGGTGKTFLLSEFRSSAQRIGSPTGWTDDSETNVLGVMRRLALDLDSPKEMKKFDDLQSRYETLVGQLLTDNDAPEELAAAIGRGATRSALAVGTQVPGLGIALSLVDDDAVSAEGAKVALHIAQKLKRPVDVALVTDPIAQLTDAFIDGLRMLASGGRPIALFFDQFERTASFLEPWLLSLFDGEHGELPATLVGAVAGQQSLSPLSWSEHELFIERIPLGVFSVSEAQTYLSARGISDPSVTQAIIRISGRLPILLATLASESPRNLAEVGDPSGTAIDVFLSWLESPDRRSVAIDASLARLLNEDVLGAIVESREAHEHFAWLRKAPFVEERLSGWTYHEVVRAHLVRHKRKESPKAWSECHLRVAKFYAERMSDKNDEIPPEAQVQDRQWQANQVEFFYHRLCADVSTLPETIATVVRAVNIDLAWAQALARAVRDAGADLDSDEVARWGTYCLGLTEDSDDTIAEQAFEALLSSTQAPIVDVRVVVLQRQGRRFAEKGKSSDALVAFESALALDSNNGGLLADRARILGRLGKTVEAIADINTAMAEAVDDPSFTQYLLEMRGRFLLNQDDVEGAAADAEQGLLLAPGEFRLLALQAEILARRGETDAASHAFHLAAQREPLYQHEALQRIGQGLVGAARYDEAVDALVKALRLAPSCGHCWATLIRIARATDQARVGDFLRGLGLEQELNALGRVRRAVELGDAGFVEDAVSEFNALDSIDLHDMGAFELNQYGLWLTHVDRLEDAIRIYRTATQQDASGPILTYNLAVAEAVVSGAESVHDRLSNARRILGSLSPDGDGRPAVIRSYGLAGIDAVERHSDDAFGQLDRALEISNEEVKGWLARDIAWRGLRDDPRYADALNRQTVKTLVARPRVGEIGRLSG